MKSWQLSGIAGVVFVVLSMLASLTNVQPPSYDAQQSKILAWFAEESDRYRIGHTFAGLAFLLFYFPFFAGLYARLRIAEGGPATWSRVSIAGAVICPAAGTTAGTFIMAAALQEGDVSPDVAAFVLAANFYAYTVSGAFSGVTMAAAAVVIVRTAVFSRWLGWFGAISGLAGIAGTAALIENDPAGIFATLSSLGWSGFFIWTLALAVSLIRSSPGLPAQASP